MSAAADGAGRGIPGRIDMRKFGPVRIRAIHMRPYLATALFAMNPKAMPGIGTMAVDKYWNLYIDPDVLDEWDMDGQVAALIHEVGHLLRDHAARGEALGVGQREARVWNVAGDAELNDDLVHEGFKLPVEKPVTPSALNLPPHQVVELYYDALLKRAEQAEQQQQQGGGHGGQGQGGEGELQPPVPGGDHQDCGSGADGVERDYEDKDAQNGENGSVNEIQGELIRRKTAEDIREAVRSGGEEAGRVPGSWQRWAEELLRPRVDWRKSLAASCRRAIASVSGAHDYSYSRPSRRRLPGVVLPSMRRPLPEVAIVVDTSGSMGDELVAEALAEVEGICKAAVGGGGVRVIAVDAAVQTVKRVLSAKQVELAGGGGTDMGVGLAHAVSLRPRPDVVVVLTDGYTPWPPSPPAGVKVVVGVVGGGLKEGPPWATTIRIED